MSSSMSSIHLSALSGLPVSGSKTPLIATPLSSGNHYFTQVKLRLRWGDEGHV